MMTLFGKIGILGLGFLAIMIAGIPGNAGDVQYSNRYWYNELKIKGESFPGGKEDDRTTTSGSWASAVLLYNPESNTQDIFQYSIGAYDDHNINGTDAAGAYTVRNFDMNRFDIQAYRRWIEGWNGFHTRAGVWLMNTTFAQRVNGGRNWLGTGSSTTQFTSRGAGVYLGLGKDHFIGGDDSNLRALWNGNVILGGFEEFRTNWDADYYDKGFFGGFDGTGGLYYGLGERLGVDLRYRIQGAMDASLLVYGPEAGLTVKW